MALTNSKVFNGGAYVYTGSDDPDKSTTISNNHIIETADETTDTVGAFYAKTSVPNGTIRLYDNKGVVIGDLIPNSSTFDDVIADTATAEYVLIGKNGAHWQTAANFIKNTITSNNITFNIIDGGTGQLVIDVDTSKISNKIFWESVPGGSVASIAPDTYSGSTSVYKAFGTLVFLDDYLTLTSSTSSVYFMLSQGSISDAYFAIYQVDASDFSSCTQVCKTGPFTMSQTGLCNAPLACDATLNPGHIYYHVLFIKDNGWQIEGPEMRSANINVSPYPSAHFDNLSIASTDDIPETITWAGENLSRFYTVVKA